MRFFPAGIALASAILPTSTALPTNETQQCRKTQVAVLGAGVAGITAAQALTNSSVHDFVIVERNDYIGGRVAHTTFGTNPTTGEPYTVELGILDPPKWDEAGADKHVKGANWVQGLGSEGGPENPIWTLAKKYNVTNTYSNYSSILTYNETGYTDFASLIGDFEVAYALAEQEAGYILTENLQDYDSSTGFSMSGWRPRKDMAAQAADWWSWDFETAYPPDQSSFEFGIAGYNLTFYQFSDENNFVWDQRGFNSFVIGEAETFLQPDDHRLMLNTQVTNISYSDTGVVVHNSDGSCIEAYYAVCTFSLGVLQQTLTSFEPELPRWKQLAIDKFQMGTYTKIFMQFNETFWDADTEFFLYADPTARGYYPVFQSLSAPGFIPESNILFVTVVDDDSYRVESQSDEETEKEVMQVLRAMFPERSIPDPTDFMYPRWSLEEWAYGSYSNWPVGVTLEGHQNLRANVDHLFFAGEHTSTQYFGFLHGAWFEGRNAGQRVAGLLGADCVGEACGVEVHYERLYGTTGYAEFDVMNGWTASSFETWGLDA